MWFLWIDLKASRQNVSYNIGVLSFCEGEEKNTK